MIPYQLTVNGGVVLQGTILGTGLVIIFVLGAIALFINFFWHTIWGKINENETLKYEFITIIAHKFRTPLTQVKWLIEGLLGSETDSFKRESLAEMGKANDNLIKMTGSLVELTDSDAASASSYEFERVNLCEFVRTIADGFKNAFHQKNLFFSVQCAAPEIYAKVDRSRMEFVLGTLIENAIAYSPPGRNVQITVNTDKNKAVVAIADNGIGIDPRDLPRVFSKLFRAKNAQSMDTEGFGIGLYLAQTVTKRHKGRIAVYSEGSGRGSTFSVILPLA